mgnify:CR=1 FL=1
MTTLGGSDDEWYLDDYYATLNDQSSFTTGHIGIKNPKVSDTTTCDMLLLCYLLHGFGRKAGRPVIS